MKYKDIIAQIENLQKKADSARRTELAAVIADIKAKMAEFGITLADLRDTKAKKRGKKSAVKKARKKGAKVAVKYRNAKTGETWTGRGRTPKWLADAEANGAKRESFAV